jgi:hypothetical protein
MTNKVRNIITLAVLNVHIGQLSHVVILTALLIEITVVTKAAYIVIQSVSNDKFGYLMLLL